MEQINTVRMYWRNMNLIMQWRVQDLKEGGARARKILSHAPQNVDHAPH